MKVSNLWQKIKAWFDFSECSKEALGYKCQHRPGECDQAN